LVARILLVDDHRMILNGLRSLMRLEPGIEVLAGCSDGLSALKAASELRPDLVVLDVTLPGLNGIEVTKRLLRALPDTRVVALSMHADAHYVAEMLRAGALGYVLKDDDYDELLAAISAAMNGRRYLSSAIAGLSVRDFLMAGESGEPFRLSTLTTREREVLHWLAEGMTIKQIAAKLNLSPKTLYSHREHIMDKLEVPNGAKLLKIAILLEESIRANTSTE